MHIQLIGVPYDLNRRAQRMGQTPGALLPRLRSLALQSAEPVMVEVSDLVGDEIPDVACIQAALATEVRAADERGAMPLVIGGDCTVALGAVAGMQGAIAGMIWIDAHGDFNTPAISPSGYLGGMPLATIAGRGLPELRVGVGLAQPFPEERIALVGVRDLDPLERAALAQSSVTLLSTDNLRGDPASLVEMLCQVAEAGPVYLHLDVDVLDPAEMPGVVYPTADGLRFDELRALLRQIGERCTLAAVALTAVNLEPLDAAQRELVLERAESLLSALIG